MGVREIPNLLKELLLVVLLFCLGQVVVVLDPDVSKEYLDRVQNRSKEKKYAFDIAFGAESTNLVLARSESLCVVCSTLSVS